MKLQFANSVSRFWRAASYLYRKGRSKVYCLTIVAENQAKSAEGEDGSGDDSSSSGGSADTSARLLQQQQQRAPEVKQVVFGSSFFINYDMVFHLGRWEVAFAESSCPSTDLQHRLKH